MCKVFDSGNMCECSHGCCSLMISTLCSRSCHDLWLVHIDPAKFEMSTSYANRLRILREAWTKLHTAVQHAEVRRRVPKSMTRWNLDSP